MGHSALGAGYDAWKTQGPPEFDVSDREVERWHDMLRDWMPTAVENLVNIMSEAIDPAKIPFEVDDNILDPNRIMGRLAVYLNDDDEKLARIMLGLGVIQDWQASLEDYTEATRQADDESAADAAADHAYDSMRDGD